MRSGMARVAADLFSKRCVHGSAPTVEQWRERVAPLFADPDLELVIGP
jgi:hypothetical protein